MSECGGKWAAVDKVDDVDIDAGELKQVLIDRFGH